MNDIEDVTLETEEETAAEPLEYTLATVSELNASGVKLIFPGEDQSDGKVYRCNAMQRFAVGDLVKVVKDSGTYIAEYVIGARGIRYPMPSGGSRDQVLLKNSSSDYDIKWGAAPGTLPTGGTTGQYLKKSSNANYAVEWGAVSGTLPTGGTAGQYLKKSSKTDYAVEWADISVSGTLPTGGAAGQYLAKSTAANYACSWVTSPVTGSSTTIGFMNTTARAKQSVSKCSASGTLSNAITTINNLLTALANYGLITSY